MAPGVPCVIFLWGSIYTVDIYMYLDMYMYMYMYEYTYTNKIKKIY